MDETPRANRVHIAFFGKTNAGKSSVINRITGSDLALVSNVAGTTTDPVYKSMELLPMGPVVFIDTAGLDDATELGQARLKKTEEVVDKTDIAVMVVRAGDTDLSAEQEYAQKLRQKKTPVIFAYNIFSEADRKNIKTDENSVVINAQTGEGIDALKKKISEQAGGDELESITGDMVKPGDTVLLVMPQDVQAPKGRLILPQVQVIRDLLDNSCKIVMVKTEDLASMLEDLKHPPALVITDSQVFKYVNEHLDKDIPLTSFSMLMAKNKGDIEKLVKGARAIASLVPGDRVLIAESCTHHAQKGDIAREKLPKWLEEYVGGPLEFDTVAGHGFAEDISKYKLILHCGGCMINRKNMLSKMETAEKNGVPITNFGVAIAFLHSMLDRVTW
ncbi:MAG: [FeFe] hydrogenase H-cluster maturation GTPase HydF [Christensenellaceae bacterium]